MLRYLTSAGLRRYPDLQATMFADRAAQFRDRLGWAVSVDASGWERDEYDAADPLYVIWQNPDGRHGGSMRFLPTTGRTMVNDHFARLVPGGRIEDASIWECTRFCLSEGAGHQVTAALMLGGAEVGAGFGLRQSVGVFDVRMVRIYRRLGWPPQIIGQEGAGRDAIGLGLWAFSDATRHMLAGRAGLSAEVSHHFFRMDQGDAARAA
jgi:acyl homoserine lactone synthase